MTLNILQSRLVLLLLIVMHVAALLSLLVFGFVAWWMLLVVFGLCFSFVFSFYHYYLRLPIDAVRIDGAQWYLRVVGSEWCDAQLQPTSIVTRYLIILNFKVRGRFRVYSIPLFMDSLGVQDMRRLRVLLLQSTL